ncbi:MULTISPECIES: hypothetical protein [Comamonas]|uniref:hypothetical protein n=1 Tax=Comamonas TaxID=283 RepID=UPI0005103CAE|nr:MULTISPECIES: hypothetical protein [Comamonas]KGH29331.1 hypothetical protein P606_02820 [Comamonas thiooxydans]GAO72162.1 hypothetical protein CSE6_020_35990 [Comamonas sp. E6]
MKSFKPKTAEVNFREAFERLKAGAPKVLPPDALVSQNNVSKEAGCDPSALRKSRFPGLIAEIQSYLISHNDKRAPSKRQQLFKQRQQTRNAREIINDLRRQRDATASLLVEANAQVGILTRRVRDLEALIEDLQSKARISLLQPAKARATPRAIDMPDGN